MDFVRQRAKNKNWIEESRRMYGEEREPPKVGWQKNKNHSSESILLEEIRPRLEQIGFIYVCKGYWRELFMKENEKEKYEINIQSD